MKTSMVRKSLALVSFLFGSSAALLAAGCGAPDESTRAAGGEQAHGEQALGDQARGDQALEDVGVEVGEVGQAITGGWQALTPINGWTNYYANGAHAPSVGKVNGVVTFRGALKNTTTSSTEAFLLPVDYRPDEAVNLRVVMNGNSAGSLQYNYLTGYVHILQDGADGVGADAKTLTSLEGASFDQVEGNVLTNNEEWDPLYGFRLFDQDRGAYVKTVDNFVRFQGFLFKLDLENYDGYLFTLPSAYRPSNTVFVTANFGLPAAATGQLTIYSSGDVYTNGDLAAANEGVSFEGVSYSKTLAGNIALPLAPGWGAYSARSVKVGKYGDVVRFQGAIAGGTSATIATLPTGYRPAQTVRLAATANGGLPAKITIATNGVMTVSSPGGVANVSPMLSLDGVSFAL